MGSRPSCAQWVRHLVSDLVKRRQGLFVQGLHNFGPRVAGGELMVSGWLMGGWLTVIIMVTMMPHDGEFVVHWWLIAR